MAASRDPVPAFRVRCQANLRELNGLLYAAGQGPLEDPEVYHDLHRALRRVRSDARLWTRFADPDDRPTLERTDRRLRELSRMVGQVRDRSVGERLLLDMVRQAPNRSARSWQTVVGRFRDESHIGQLLVAGRSRKILESGEVRLLLAHVAPALKRGRDRFPKVASKETKRRARSLQRAIRKALRDPEPERFHEARISLRRYRSLQSALEAAPRWPAALARLQADLGDWHDLRLLHDRLEAAHPTLAVRRLLTTLDRAEAPLARKVTKDLKRFRDADGRATGPSSG